MTWDPTDDQRARENRTRKAVQIAEWMWHRNLDAITIAGWDAATLRRVARAAGVNPPRDGSPTWDAVAEGLTRWEGERTGDREHLNEHADWCAGCGSFLLHPTANDSVEPLPVDSPPATELAGPDDPPAAETDEELVGAFVESMLKVGQSWPKGWCALVALGPVDPPKPCTVLVDSPNPAVVDGVPCGEPAVVRTPTSTGADVWRCAGHPPLAGEWGYGLNHAPSRCVAPLRCFCGRHEVTGRTPSGDTILDQQAIASGRRRSSPRRYTEAREALS